jgi:hypothetical protein
LTNYLAKRTTAETNSGGGSDRDQEFRTTAALSTIERATLERGSKARPFLRVYQQRRIGQLLGVTYRYAVAVTCTYFDTLTGAVFTPAAFSPGSWQVLIF